MQSSWLTWFVDLTTLPQLLIDDKPISSALNRASGILVRPFV
jgi:hypothetical protein